MKVRRSVYFPLVVALSVPAGMWAQSQEVPASSAQNPNINVVQKPMRKADQAITNDSIALLAVRRTPGVIVSPAAEGVSDTTKEQSAAAGETVKTAAEIALVEQQIRDKQKRIALLLRLFVDDERAFLNDPGNAKVDAAAVERRRYEQDELRWETAELARLKERRRELGGSL
jgi:hypothetical protein